MSQPETVPLRTPLPPKFSWPAAGRLIRLSNQSGTFLLMLPTLWSLVLASQGKPSWRLLVIFIAGSFLMRSAGVVLNDVADRSIDRQVSRTRSRPLAAGEFTVGQALGIAAFLILGAAALVLLLNPLTMLLSPVALALAGLYPFAKRVIHIPQAMLGMAFGWGTVMAWAAVRNAVEAPAWYLYGATMCWAMAYDTIYAIQDLDDDRRIGVKSSALFFGSSIWVAIAVCCTGTILCLVAAGQAAHVGHLYYGTLAVVGGVFAYQVRWLCRPLTPQAAFTMFWQHVWIGATILIGILLGFL